MDTKCKHRFLSEGGAEEKTHGEEEQATRPETDWSHKATHHGLLRAARSMKKQESGALLELLQEDGSVDILILISRIMRG